MLDKLALKLIHCASLDKAALQQSSRLHVLVPADKKAVTEGRNKSHIVAALIYHSVQHSGYCCVSNVLTKVGE